MQHDGTNPRGRPIGFWIKAADRALDRAVDDLHEREGLSRRLWQVMNAVAEDGPVAGGRIAAVLAPMLAEDEVATALAELESRALVGPAEGGLRLTAAGSSLLAALAARQEGLRSRVAAGIEPAAWATTVATLSRIVANLSEEG